MGESPYYIEDKIFILQTDDCVGFVNMIHVEQ